jgi:hypothetical protein
MELFQAAPDMLFNRSHTQVKHERDLGIAFSLRYPGKDFAFPWCQRFLSRLTEDSGSRLLPHSSLSAVKLEILSRFEKRKTLCKEPLNRLIEFPTAVWRPEKALIVATSGRRSTPRELTSITARYYFDKNEDYE